MKEVLVIIRPDKMNATKQALAQAGIHSMHAKDCLGRGKGLVDLTALKGAELGYEEAIAQLGQTRRLIPKRMVSIIVPDKLVSRVVETVINTNKTGKSGDGKIFVMPVHDATRVRTGEVGESVLDE